MENTKIIIVDDVELHRVYLKTILNENGYEVVDFENGEDCISYLEDHSADLILLDIMMPGISGTGVLVNLREKFSPLELPIIMVTGKSDEEDIISSLKLGANDFIEKPVNINIALARIEAHLNSSRLNRESNRSNEIRALNALIATYNHEINNPLTVISSVLDRESKKHDGLQMAIDATARIAGIIVKIAKTTENSPEYIEYFKHQKMIDLKDI